jgi:diguanylate cyclase (GGDEF)-like protein
MTPIRGPLARLDRSRDELAKAWLVRLIERASLDEIKELPTDRIARELPELISDIVGAVGETNGDPYELTEEQAGRAASLAALRSGRDTSAGDVARDVAALQAVLVRALRDELAEEEPERFAEAVERLADATGAIQAAAVEELIRRRSRELESQANTDALTGLGNLRHLQKQIGHMLEIHKRYSHPFAVLLMDIDGLKRINDAHGHQAGDRVLMQVAMALQRSIRSVDVAARLGGDEFCVLAPEQDSDAAATLAERLATAVRDEVASPSDPPVGLSIGVVSCPTHGNDAETLVDTADRAMYRAKAAGDSVAMGEPAPAEAAEEGGRSGP